MASKYYFLNIVIGILIIITTSIGIGIAFFYYNNIFIGSIVIIALFIEVILFIKNMNSINRKIASFILAVQNEDTSIILPKESNSKSIGEIYKALNNVVLVFQNMKIESEFKEQLFLAMIEHSSTGFISIDQHGDFEIMNQTARNLLGVSYTSNLDRMERQLPEFFHLLSDLTPGEVKSCQITHERVSTIIQISASKLRFKDKELRLISLLDIKKEIESREIESWQKLIRIMNHEIMNSIAPITSVSKSLLPIFLKNNKPITPLDLNDKKICDTINGLEVIESMSSGLNNFVHNYRKLAQIPKPVVKTIVVEKWVENLTTISTDIIQQNNAQLIIDIQQNIKSFQADEGLLNQVLLNLIKNAAEAPILQEQKRITLLIETNVDNKTIIKVINNGKAISNDILDKIFVPFFTTKDNGVGIGLFISRQIINSHNGTLSVYSAENEDTIFQIIL
jgi:two-component system, NtrC family, nitrogen regulation sensor histidine kinase NtrY